MPNESGVIICPNPKCHREIEEPILLNVLSTTPAEQYYACPHCFIKLDADAENEEDVKQESSPPFHSSLEKVLDVISTQSQNAQNEKEETKKEEPSVKQKEKKEKGPPECPHHFGYLASRPKNAPIPQECLICQKIVDCMLKLGAT